MMTTTMMAVMSCCHDCMQLQMVAVLVASAVVHKRYCYVYGHGSLSSEMDASSSHAGGDASPSFSLQREQVFRALVYLEHPNGSTAIPM